MDDFIERYALALLGSPDAHLSAQEEAGVLELARIVAHSSERKNAPLASYISGLYCALDAETAEDRRKALARALHTARTLLPEKEA
jgi:hypothetical protein